MKKKFLLDTNVLMHSPTSIYVFEENDVIVCLKTLDELDRNKTAVGEKGYNARNAIREIYYLRQKGDLTEGVELPGGGTFTIVKDAAEREVLSRAVSDDDIIIATADKNNAILVTNDIGMIIKADVKGVKCETFRNEEVDEESLKYTGRRELLVDDDTIDLLYEVKSFDASYLNIKPIVNEFFVLKGAVSPQKSALAYFDGCNIKLLTKADITISDLFTPKNVGQKFIVKALLAPVEEVPLVIIRGAAGTGKTFAALAAGLQALKKQSYKKILLLRPNVKFEDDIGYLPGTEFEKIEPLLRPFKDNLEVLLRGSKEPTKEIENMFNKGTLRAESLAYIRGRSIADSYVIVDECQNATALQMKSIITRVGNGSKIVLLGDPDQIDNPRVNRQNNGLVYAAGKMRGSQLCMQLVMENEECVRCPLALEAVQRLV